MREKLRCFLMVICLLAPMIQVSAQPQRYYAPQLTGRAAVFYQALLENIEVMKTQPAKIEMTDYFEDNSSLADAELLIHDLTAACRALEYDHPEYFWFEPSQIRMYTSQVVRGDDVLRYKVRIEPPEGGTYFAEGFDAQTVDEKAAQAEAAADRVAAQAAQEESDYDKVRVAHDILVRETSYDQEQRKTSHSAYAALVEHKAVCDGYAGAFQMILDRLEIPCISVSGEARADGSTEAHMWNMVQIGGNWYGVDVTWDDPVPVGGGFEMLSHSYFLLGADAMQRSHTPDLSFYEGGPAYTLPELHPRGYAAQQLLNLWDQLLNWVSSWTGWIFA